jgi:toxin ParE1/3/4
MSLTIYKKPRAERDLIEHFAFIAKDKIAPADRFLREAQRTIENLAAMPGIGRAWNSQYPRHAGIHVCPMPPPYRKYLIFYRYDDSSLEILSVIHGARDLDTVMANVEPE